MIDIYAACRESGWWYAYRLVRSVDGVLAWEFEDYDLSLQYIDGKYHPFIINHDIVKRKQVFDTLFDKPGGTRREYKKGDL